MSPYVKWFVLFVVFTISSGIAGENDHPGVCIALGICSFVFAMVIGALYVDYKESQ